jgi:hypothetical protein
MFLQGCQIESYELRLRISVTTYTNLSVFSCISGMIRIKYGSYLIYGYVSTVEFPRISDPLGPTFLSDIYVIIQFMRLRYILSLLYF